MMTRNVFLACALVLWGCGPRPGERPEPPAAPPATVHAAAAIQSEWPAIYQATGTVRARTAAQISARITAAARDVLVRAGDHVRAGQPLVILDARDLDARKRQAAAALAEATSAEAEAASAIASSAANLDLAESTFRRMKDLHDKASLSNQEFDEAGARLRVAQAAAAMAQARRKQAEAKITQAREEAAALDIQSGYAILTAPFAGVISEKTVEPGAMVTPGAPLLTLEREGAWRLEAAIEESQLAKFRPGSRATVVIDAIQQTIQAAVTEITPAVDASSRAFVAKIDLPPSPLLRTGLFGRAKLETGTRAVLSVPTSAAIDRGGAIWVFVIDGNTARGRIVTLGEHNADRVEVLTGLAAGDRVIAPVPAGLADGSRIEVRP